MRTAPEDQIANLHKENEELRDKYIKLAWHKVLSGEVSNQDVSKEALIRLIRTLVDTGYFVERKINEIESPLFSAMCVDEEVAFLQDIVRAVKNRIQTIIERNSTPSKSDNESVAKPNHTYITQGVPGSELKTMLPGVYSPIFKYTWDEVLNGQVKKYNVSPDSMVRLAKTLFDTVAWMRKRVEELNEKPGELITHEEIDFLNEISRWAETGLTILKKA